MATDWEDAGLPCIRQDGYSFTRDIGLLQTPFWAPQLRQAMGFKQPRWSFRCSAILAQDELRLAEDFLDQNGYSWFTLPLISDGCLRSHNVRLIDAYQIASFDGNMFELSFYAQAKMPVSTPSLAPYTPAVAAQECCLPDDFQCCGDVECCSIVFYDQRQGDWLKTDGSPFEGATTAVPFPLTRVAIEFNGNDDDVWTNHSGLAQMYFGVGNLNVITGYWVKLNNVILLNFSQPYAQKLTDANGDPYFYITDFSFIKIDQSQPASVEVTIQTPGCGCDTDQFTNTYRIA